VSILVAGHYCHDTLFGNAGTHRTVGGTAAYASAILEALGESHEVIAKVGADFLYADLVSHPAIVVPGPTTSFIDDYRGAERLERVDAVTPAIEPDDLHGTWEVGLAGAVVGEVPLRTLQRLRRICRIVVADAQSILREFSPRGEVFLRPPSEEVFGLIDVVKASRREAEVLDLRALQGRLTVVVTDGKEGCTVLRGSARFHLPAYPAREKDPTGAGDCFLAGFAAALARALPLEGAARVGAWCGARAVEHIGLPRLTPQEARAAMGCARPP